VRNQADAIMRLMRSPETVVHFVTLLEEMPVQETCDGVEDVRALGLPIGGVFVNMVRTPLLRQADLTAAAKGRLDRGAIATGLKAAGMTPRPDGSSTAADRGREHAQRVALEKRSARRRPWGPTYELRSSVTGSTSALYDLPSASRAGRGMTRRLDLDAWSRPGPASSSAAAPAGSARPRPRGARLRAPKRGVRSSSSRSTRPGLAQSMGAGTSSTTRPARCRASTPGGRRARRE
jgi:hypothetical protein